MQKGLVQTISTTYVYNKQQTIYNKGDIQFTWEKISTYGFMVGNDSYGSLESPKSFFKNFPLGKTQGGHALF